MSIVITYEDVIPSLIPNTTMKKGMVNGVHRNYIIEAIDGYVLHDNVADGIDENENIILRFSVGECSCGKNYDFSTTQKQVPDINGNTVIVDAYGSREFFAFPESLVPNPEDNIYGLDEELEIM